MRFTIKFINGNESEKWAANIPSHGGLTVLDAARAINPNLQAAKAPETDKLQCDPVLEVSEEKARQFPFFNNRCHVDLIVITEEFNEYWYMKAYEKDGTVAVHYRLDEERLLGDVKTRDLYYRKK